MVRAGIAAIAAVSVAAGLASAAGDPRRGELLWLEHGCGVCHTFRAAGSTGRTGPDIDRWLVPHAIRAGLPADRFALSRIRWGGRGMVAYGPQLTAQELDDLVAFVLGRPFTSPPGGAPRVRGFDPPPRLVTARPATVARWVARRRLRGPAARGAGVFAREGCLSCHRYGGTGARRLGAPDLTTIGRTRRLGYLRRYTERAYGYGNTEMPAYADLGDLNLDRIAAFLAASR